MAENEKLSALSKAREASGELPARLLPDSSRRRALAQEEE